MHRARFSVSIAIVAAAIAACGGKVLVDQPPNGSGGAAGGGRTGGTDPGGTACPSVVPSDAEVQALAGTACSIAGEVCKSNNGCGGCSVTCTGGVWVSTDAELCYFIGAAC
jgi:hypothetical protein